jgi:simple sugar transport system permease protein
VRRTHTIALGATAGAVLLLAAILAIAGYSPGRALIAFWDGSLGSWYSLTSGTLLRATPLTLAGLAIAIAFRAVVLNIGVEGQLLIGATTATAVALSAHVPDAIVLPLALIAGAAGGVAWAAIPAWLRRHRGVLEVISTLLLNSVALYLVSWLVRSLLQEHTRTYPQSDLLRAAARLPIVLPSTRLHAGFLIALFIAGVAWWAIARTAWGFRLRTVGANPFAAASAGQIDVPAMATNALLISGALAGLAGAVEVHGVTYSLFENVSPGYGYTAIAVALLARLDARAIVPSAILFAALESGAGAMQRDAGVPIVLVKVVEALLIIFVLIADAWRRRAASLASAAA